MKYIDFDYIKLNKNLKKDFSDLNKVKVSILSDSSSQFINNGLKALGYEYNFNFDIYEADYDQIDMQIFDKDSELYNFNAEFVFIFLSTEKLLARFYKLDYSEREHFFETESSKILDYYNFLKNNSKSKVIVNTLLEIDDKLFGHFGNKVKSSFLNQVRRLNVNIMNYAETNSDLFVLDLQNLASFIGYENIVDSRFYINSGLVFNFKFIPYVAKAMIDIIKSVKGNIIKCVIVDLDNTMWGGIIGDDGIEGIEIGELGIGKAFTEFQKWLKELKNRGIIICVNSKNEYENAILPFENHPDMILKKDDISVFVANWENKADNIKYIKDILNIGYDSMVFIDDNPFEREMVKTAFADILVPELPNDPVNYLTYLKSLNLFETISFTEEDRIRTKTYLEEKDRVEYKKSFQDEDNYLESLEMYSEVNEINKFTIPRVAQLTQRSNQFNLRTIRYTDEDIKRISSSDEYITFTFTLNDKFGEHGLISVIILKKISQKEVFIDTYIMSCRVLKRTMENFILNEIVKRCKRDNFEILIGEYIPTLKNNLVKELYPKLGFKESENKWYLNLPEFKELTTFIRPK